jgi:hypothetical protein
MARRRKAKSDKPVGGGGARHPNSLANLRSAPAAPLGHTRSLLHGGRSELLLRDVDAEVRELMDALGESDGEVEAGIGAGADASHAGGRDR